MPTIAELRIAVMEQERIVQTKKQALHVENMRLNGLTQQLQETILFEAEALRKSKSKVNKNKIQRVCNQTRISVFSSIF